MGQSESKKKIEQQFQIYKIEKDGNALLRSKRDDKEYLMRVVTCASLEDMARLKAVLESRAQLKNHHLLSLVQIKEKQQDFICSIHYKMYLVLEYSFKNAGQEIKERGIDKNYFMQSDLWSILYSCCTALHVLYSNSNTHQSLTDQQIFISKDGFVKLTEPMLFGLQKNHLEAMRAKQQGKVQVHLSPQIMNCLEDQNFFYYEKEKSDIFVMAMIIVDLALLSHNYLYDPVKKRPNLDLIPTLLSQMKEKYSDSLVGLLEQMLRLDSKLRPNLAQIIDRVQKCNNIGEDFTVETESNLKSNQLSSERDQQKFIFQKPMKYRELKIRAEQVHQDNMTKKLITEQISNRQEQGSLTIKDSSKTAYFNVQNFDGRVFAVTPQQANCNPNPIFFSTNPPHQINQQQLFQNPIPNNYPTDLTPPNNLVKQPSIALNVQTQKVVPLGGNQKPPFNLYERSRSIDSIKITSNQYSRVQQGGSKFPFSAMKNQGFSAFDSFKKTDPEPKTTHQPIFTHQIPQVYNIMIRNTKLTQKEEMLSKQERAIVTDNEHVSTPQFNGEISKVNRFTSFRNYPYETVSRQDNNEYPTFQQLDLKKNISHTQSQMAYKQFNKKEKEQKAVDGYSNASPPPNNKINANIQLTNNTIIGNSNSNSNPFALSTPFPSHSPIQPYSSSFSNSTAIFNPLKTNSYSNIPNSLSRNTFSPSKIDFSPSKIDFSKPCESYTCRSGFSHLTMFHNNKQNPDIKLQYVKQDIPQRGRYEGYKCNNQRNGHGTLFFKDGGHYEGEWKNDKMDGFGKLYYENGKIAYEGHWQNDEFNGQGRVYNSQPCIFEGQFNYKDFSELGTRWVYYQGLFKNDSKHGKGYIKLTNGQMYEGIFDHDMIEGNGIFYKRTGEIVIGFWIDNKLFLNQSYQQGKK